LNTKYDVLNHGLQQLFGYPQSSRRLLCSAEESNSYRTTTWGWVNDDRIDGRNDDIFV